MEALDYIAQHLDPRLILEHYNFRNIRETDGQIRSCCEIHKGNNPTAFIWNKSNNLWYCYTGDCNGGDVYTLVQKMEGVDFLTAVKKVADIHGIDITDMKVERHANLVLRDTKKWLEFMKGCTSFPRCNVNYELPYTKYRPVDPNFTRFEPEVLAFYNARFCNVFPTDDGLLYNKLVIPLYFEGVLHGVALRDLTNRYHPKWMFQPKGLEVGRLLYNFDFAIDAIKQHSLSELVLVEGIFDVWAYHNIGIDNVVAVYGSSLKKEQEKTLLRYGYDLILSFDNDNAGNKMKKQVIQKFKFKLGTTTVTLPEGKDPADCTPDELRECYLNRQ